MVKIIVAVALPTVALATSCADLCTDGGHGTTGFISGTAPFCGGVCADCGDGHCYQVEKGSVSDYGAGCASGNKVCCCSTEMQEETQEASPTPLEQTSNSSSPEEDDLSVGVPTCGQLCADGGHGTTGFISGTAPFCGGVCADCGDGHCYQVEKGSVSDYGHGCTSGNKVCCCSKEMQEEAATLAVTWENCSARAMHALITDVLPNSITSGKTWNIWVTGTVDEDVQPSIWATVSAHGEQLTECKGSDEDAVCQLPMGAGNITVKAVGMLLKRCPDVISNPNCPFHLPVEVTTSSILPPSLASLDVHVVAIKPHSEKDVFCLDVHIEEMQAEMQEASPSEQTSKSSSPEEDLSVPTCGQLCTDGGHGTTGFISGTAPFCGGVCADCGDGHCYQVEKGSVSDYGHGCTSGSKVCCCSKEMVEGSHTIV